MDTPLMPDPASGENSPELGVPAPGVHGGHPGAASAPEPTPAFAASEPWASPSPPPSPLAGGWAPPVPPPPAWPQTPWGPAAGGPPPAPPSRRGLALGFGAALIAGGVAGAAVMGTVGNRTGGSATASTPVTTPAPVQRQPFGGRFANPYPGGTGSSGSTTTPSTIDPASVAGRVDPAVVDITSNLTNGTAAGTGMVITAAGQVLTNNHVIQGATFITAQIGGTGKKYRATVVGADPADDVALLQLQGVTSNLTTISVGDASKVAVGDPVVALGNALGQGDSTAAGSVVAVGQTITATDDTGANAETLTNLIQVDANVQPGDSGGPLIDATGKVIGMDTAASTSGRGFRFRGTSAQGFAIPIDTAMSIVQQLRNGGGAPQTAAQTALLGVEVADASSQGTTGALVVGIAPGTPAESAGLTAGDVIVTFGGKSITSPATLSTAVKATKPGDRVQVAWLDQNGQQHSTTVQLAGQSAPAA